MTPTPNNTEVNNPSQITPPLEWPRATAGKQTLEVRWDLFAQYILSLWGCNVRQLNIDFNTAKLIAPAVLNSDGTEKTPAELEGPPGLMVAFFTLFAACVAHNYHKLAVDPPKADYWATVIEDGQVKECASAIREAMGKRQSAKKVEVPAPLTAPEPVAQ
jgi:hypothetical protein